MMDAVALGRRMMERSADLADDALCNGFARVGNQLVRLGEPRAPRSIRDLPPEDRAIMDQAVQMFLAELKKD